MKSAWVSRVVAGVHLVTLMSVAATVVATPAAASDERPTLDGAPDIETLRGRITAILARDGVPGAGIVLVREDEVLWAGGVGLADVASGRPVTAETIFRLGSISKSVTALAVMRLVERGALSLETPLREIAPEVEFDNPWESTHPVRLAHLLEHTAGFEFARFNEEMDLGPESRSLLEALAVNPRSRRSRWPPGTRMSYSNHGYLAAGYVLEKVTGRPFDEVVRDEVFAPLGMADAAFKLTPEARARLAVGYGQGGQAESYHEDMHRPAANLLATPNDMARYLRFWLGRGELDGRRWLSLAGLERIESRRTLPYAGPAEQYGLANATMQHEGFVGRGHDGYIWGFISSFRYFPEERVGWALMLNNWAASSARPDIERELLGFLLRGQAPPAPLPFEIPADQLAPYAGYYRNVTPGEVIWEPLRNLLGGTEIEFADGALWQRGAEVRGLRGLFGADSRQRLLPTADGAFRREGESISSLYFTRTNDGRQALVTVDGYLERVPHWLAGAERLLFFGALLCLLSAVALAPFWLLQALLAGHPPSQPWARVWPLLAALAALALVLVVKRSPEPFGQVNATTLAIFLLSSAFPVLAALALWSAIRVPIAELGLLAKAHLLLVSGACSGLTLFAWRAHWLALRTWVW